jgi:hypothetical protein
LRALGLPFTEAELTHIRTAMALYRAAQQPKLTYDGWKIVGLALNMGEVRAKQQAKGVVHSRGPYGPTIRQFLNATGFAFINGGIRFSLREIIDRLDEVDAWHEALLPSDRDHLNNPIDVRDRFFADKRNPKAQARQHHTVTRQKRGYPSLLEEYHALQDALAASQERSSMLEDALQNVLAVVPFDTLARLDDDKLREMFARLPEQIQDKLHARLYPKSSD